MFITSASAMQVRVSRGLSGHIYVCLLLVLLRKVKHEWLLAAINFLGL